MQDVENEHVVCHYHFLMVAEPGRAAKANCHDEVAGDGVGNRRTAWRLIASVEPKYEQQATCTREYLTEVEAGLLKINDDTRRVVSNGAHSVAPHKRSLEDQLTKANKSEFSPPLEAERANLAQAETSLAAVLASVAASKNSCALVTADQEVSM